MALHDALADRQADARAGIFLAVVQALEDDEDALEILGLDADAVVADRENPVLFIFFDTHMDHGWFLAMELNGIPDQVLEERLQLDVIRHHLRQWIVSHTALAFFNRDLQVAEYAPGLLRIR